MKKWFLCLLLILLASPFFVFAEEKTIVGEVVDLSCYVAAGARGMEHQQCAIACIKVGEPAGILDDKTGKVYIVITEDHATNPAEKVLPFVSKMVEVKGNVSERSGINVIDIKEIKENAMKEMPMKEKGMKMEDKGMGY